MKSGTKPIGATSYKETAFGIISRPKLLALEIRGTKKGLEHINNLMKTNRDISITSDLILKLHHVSFAWIFPRWAGKYRKIQVSVSGRINFYKAGFN